MVVIIKDLIGLNAVSMSQGYILFDVLKLFFLKQNDEIIILDFNGVDLISSPFFNSSVCLLLEKNSIEFCQKKIKFLCLNEYSTNILNICLKNAIEFYRN